MSEDSYLTQDQIALIMDLIEGMSPSGLNLTLGYAAILLAAAELIWIKAGEDGGELFEKCQELRKIYGEAAHITGDFNIS